MLCNQNAHQTVGWRAVRLYLLSSFQLHLLFLHFLNLEANLVEVFADKNHPDIICGGQTLDLRPLPSKHMHETL